MTIGSPKRLPAVFYRSEAGAEPVRDWLKSDEISAEDRRGHQDRGIRLAGRDTDLSPNGQRVVGSAEQPERTHRARAVLHQRRAHGAAARLHQEGAAYAGRRSGAGLGTEAQSGDGSMSGKRRIGSSFDEFLAEEGLLDQATMVAQKRVLAWQLAKAMRERKITKAALARRMRTSRSALDRLLDPRNASVTLATMGRAAAALGKRLSIDLTDSRR